MLQLLLVVGVGVGVVGMLQLLVVRVLTHVARDDRRRRTAEARCVGEGNGGRW
jgi:hypothetical protein